MMKTENGTSRFAHPALPAVTSAILALLLYAITLGGTYLYDDVAVVRDDPRMHDPSKWVKLWTGQYNDGPDNLYRPLVSTSYAIEWALHGDRPWIFHLVNLLLHAAVATAVAEVTRRGLGNRSTAGPSAMIAGCLFAAHPLHVEAVANIVGRAELGCALAVFGGLAILAHRPLTTGRAITLLACGFAGMLCKEQAVLQPLFWALFGWLVLARPAALPGERRVIAQLVLMTTWLWAGYLIGREHFLKFEWDVSLVDPTIQPLVQSMGIDRILMPIVLIGHYTALFVWPAHLSIDYGGNVMGWHAQLADPYLWIGAIAVIGWCIAVLFAWRHKANFILFCLISMAMTYGVVGNIITLIGTNFAERLMYLPSAFLLMAVAAALTALRSKVCIPIVAVTLVALSVRTFAAASDWNYPMRLYQHTLAATPQSIQIRLLMAGEYRRQHDPVAGNATLDAVCREYPNYWRAWMFRSIAAMDDRDLPTARRDINRAVQLSGNPILIGVLSRLAALEAADRPTPRQKNPR